MSKSVWKFRILDMGQRWLTLREGAQILSCATQRGELCIWALVDPDAPQVECRLAIFGTGHDVPDEVASSWKFLGTVQFFGGDLVMHAFLEPRP